MTGRDGALRMRATGDVAADLGRAIGSCPDRAWVTIDVAALAPVDLNAYRNALRERAESYEIDVDGEDDFTGELDGREWRVILALGAHSEGA